MIKNILRNIWMPLLVVVVFSSCGNNADNDRPSAQSNYLPPTASPLKFSSVKNIDPAGIKTINVKPLVKKLNFAKLVVHSYDTSSARPIHYETEETKTDYNNLPAKDFDLDKLPSKPLNLTVTKLAAPKTIKCRQPILKNAALSLFELAEAEGLPGKLPTCVFTDKAGFLWIATSDGLYRYDGENLLSYLNGPPDTLFIEMLEDDEGRLWISTLNGGLAILDIKNGTFSTTGPISGFKNSICRILQDKQKRIWASSINPDGINIVDPKTLLVKRLDGNNGLITSHVSGLTMDGSGQIWVGTRQGINIINQQTKKIKVFSKKYGLKSDTTDALFCDHSGNIWMSNKDAALFNPSSGLLKTINSGDFFKKNELIDFSEGIDGKIWLASAKKGLAVIDPTKQTLQNIRKSNGLDSNLVLKTSPDKNGGAWIPTLKSLNKLDHNNNLLEHIDHVAVNTLGEDVHGLIWEGTSKGINIIDRKNKTYRHLGRAEGLFNDTIQCIVEQKNKIYVSSNGGVDIIDSSLTTITHLGVKEGLHSSTINVTLIDDNGNLWLGGTIAGVDVYNPSAGTIKHMGKGQGLDETIVVDIKKDKDKNIWVSGYGDIYKITPDLKTINALSLSKGTKPLVADQDGNLWIGTPQGIFVADRLNKNIFSFSTKQGLINNQINSLLNYNNRIYAGTLKGITVIDIPKVGLDTDKKLITNSFGIRYGLTKINAGASLTDMITREGLYCWGDNGISIFDLSKKDTATFPAYITGINIMDGHQYFFNNSATQNKMVWDTITGPYNLPLNLQLHYNQNYVQFNYSVLNLTPHDTTWYEYKLAGADKSWTITSAVSSKSYYNLAPGKYAFEVAAKSQDGHWGAPANLSFTINPPWWQTWWAYIIYAALFAGSVWSFAHFRSLKLQTDKRLLEDKVNQRTEEVLQQKEEIEAQRDNLEKAFKELKNTQAQLVQSEKMASLGELTAGIAHEIQNPLNFVNNFSEVNTELIDEMQEEIEKGNYEDVKAIADDIKQNQQKISQHGKRADFIVKGMLQHSRTSKGERELTNVNILADEFLKLSYHGLRAKDKSFNAEMITNFHAELPKINIVQQDIGRVLLNLFNNAFYAVNQKKKTADNSYKPLVTVATSTQNNMVIITVKDNGTGIPNAIKEKIMQPFFTTKPTGEGTGLGLSLSYDIVVKAHNGTINIESIDGEGSEFIISLPV